jgi:hypothetical protein
VTDEWDRIFETFARPWKIIHHKSGNYYIQDQNGRVICWVYPKGMDTANHKKPSEEEALMIVKAIAKTSKRKTKCPAPMHIPRAGFSFPAGRARLPRMATGKKDGDREAELEAAIEAIRVEAWKPGQTLHHALRS